MTPDPFLTPGARGSENSCKHDCTKTVGPRHFKFRIFLPYDLVWVSLDFGDPRPIIDPWGVGGPKILVNTIAQNLLVLDISNFAYPFLMTLSGSD